MNRRDAMKTGAILAAAPAAVSAAATQAKLPESPREASSDFHGFSGPIYGAFTIEP